MEKRRSFKQLKTQMSATEFQSMAKKIAKDYANSEQRFSRSYFTEEYQISSDCFYKIIDYAIVEKLVSEDEVYKMMNKAIANQKANNSSAGETSRQHYKEMLRRRYEYSFSMFSDAQIKYITILFANHPETSKEKVAKSYELETKVLDMIIKKALCEKIVDDEIFYKVKKRSLKDLKGEKLKKAEKVFDAMWNKRETKKTALE